MRFLRNTPIRIKIALTTSVLCVFLLMSGLVAGASLIAVVRNVSSIATMEIKSRDAVDQLVHAISKTHEELSRFVIWSADRQNKQTLREQSKRVISSLANVGHLFARLSDAIYPSPRQQRLLSVLKAEWRRYAKSTRDVLRLAAVDPTIGTMMLDGTDDEFRRIDKSTTLLIHLASKQAAASSNQVTVRVWRMNRDEAVLALITVLSSIFVTWLVSRSIAKPIEVITKAMKSISDELDDDVLDHAEGNDEIGQMARAIAAFQSELASDRNALKRQNIHLDAVLSNIPHGIALYDANGQLIIDNERHGSLYPISRCAPGAKHSTIFEEKLAADLYANPELTRLEVLEALERGLQEDISIQLSDGRTIAVSHSRITDGGWVETHKDITTRRRHEAKIAYMAHHDALTGFPNRHFFNERLAQEFTIASAGRTFAVHSLDLDGFKKVNDRLGHAAGDELLVQVADRLRNCLRKTDFCARLGGDEFVIIQTECQERSPESLATDIVELVSQPYALDFGNASVTASVGIASAPQHGDTFDVLMRNVDTALYEAKKDSRGAFRRFDDVMHLRYQKRRRVEDRLRDAIENEELCLHYQPLFEVNSLRITGFEALCRWRDSEFGEVAASEFIPIAEETGLVARLGSLVLHKACQEAATWPTDQKIAVNVSPIQFRCGQLASNVRAALDQSGLAPCRLEIEITETALLNATEDIQVAIDEIKALGVRVVMDDFGAGYSSLSYLRSFRFDKLKIDKEFVREAPRHSDQRSIIRAVLELCNVLGIDTVAEGVESYEELELLRAAGCKEVQGFLFSRAVPSDQLSRFFGEEGGDRENRAHVRNAA